MSKTQQPIIDPAPSPSRSTVILMLKTFADTTWRMFVPTLGGVGLGFWADTRYSTGPWLVLCGALLGGTLAAVLVTAQLKKVSKK